jgi:O-acetyl-ADP-ribose deacetylase (regulator of RNase III)
MPFQIIRHDITKMKVDALVSSTNAKPFIGGGADFDINAAAGPKLLEERKLFGDIKKGCPILTKGYQLPAKYVIHLVAPIYIDGQHHEQEDLYQSYMSALNLAKDHEIESIAFPLISSGTYRFPRGEALEIALSAIKSFLDLHDMMIYLLVYDKASYQVSLERFVSVKNYLNDDTNISPDFIYSEKMPLWEIDSSITIKKSSQQRKLDDLEFELGETFAESLFRLIDERELNDVQVYKKANIDRKLFSKIKSNTDYQPSKMTAIAFSISLELNLDQTKDLLNKAGYSLSPSSKFDKIIQYFIEDENYDLYEINQVLFAFNQKTIGGLD